MRILFASMPFDGHFLPMTGLAQRLRREGHDVRFYAGRSFAGRLEPLGVPHVPFRRAAEINGQNLAGHFPDIDKLKGPKRAPAAAEAAFASISSPGSPETRWTRNRAASALAPGRSHSMRAAG